jgi:hypothetical protein
LGKRRSYSNWGKEEVNVFGKKYLKTKKKKLK